MAQIEPGEISILPRGVRFYPKRVAKPCNLPPRKLAIIERDRAAKGNARVAEAYRNFFAWQRQYIPRRKFSQHKTNIVALWFTLTTLTRHLDA